MGFDFSLEYGIVLEGGGAKGAYQIGVWKALQEFGVKIKGIAGVSVGALNGALMCMGDIEKAESLWEKITYSQIMNVDDVKMRNLMRGKLSQIDFKELTKDLGRIIIERGIDVKPLKQMIEEYVDEDKLINSEIELVLGTFSLSDFKEINASTNELDKGFIKDFLLASSYFPAFKNEKLHGKLYVDGGVTNNVPINLLLEREYKNIILVRVYGMGLERKVKIPEDVNIVEISPSVSLGNMLDFDSKKSIRNMKIGYFDALRILKKLDGKIYYIESSLEEENVISQLISIDEDTIEKSFRYYQIEKYNDDIVIRQLLENIYPGIAKELKLDKDWNYKRLFISMIELVAKSLKIQKYKLYSIYELLGTIKEKQIDFRDKIEDDFIELITNVVLNFTKL